VNHIVVLSVHVNGLRFAPLICNWLLLLLLNLLRLLLLGHLILLLLLLHLIGLLLLLLLGSVSLRIALLHRILLLLLLGRVLRLLLRRIASDSALRVAAGGAVVSLCVHVDDDGVDSDSGKDVWIQEEIEARSLSWSAVDSSLWSQGSEFLVVRRKKRCSDKIYVLLRAH